MTEMQPMKGHKNHREGRGLADDATSEDGFDPYNLNSSEFNGDIYLHKLMKDCNLTRLMQKEQEIFRQIQLLDSQMQTLVYENYNKFIHSTDTIRKMKEDFKKMEEQMDHLASNMAVITSFSAHCKETLQGRRQKISKLSVVHTLLKKLQFLFELPQRLRSCIANENYSLAVKHYITAQKVFLQYEHMPSFHGIQKDCVLTVSEIKSKLRAELRLKENANPKQLAVCVDLLLQLDEPKECLCTEFLEHSREKLSNDLKKLNLAIPEEENLSQSPIFMDVLEFIDLSSEFLNDMSFVISSYEELFLEEEIIYVRSSDRVTIPVEKLRQFVDEMMLDYFKVVELRISLEKNKADNAVLVLSLDRFYRRIETMAKHKLLHHINFSQICVEIIKSACKDRCKYFFEYLKQQLAKNLISIRQSLAVSAAHSQEGMTKLGELLSYLETSIVDNIKETLCNLQCFIKEEVTFASNPGFSETFCVKFVREGTIVAFFKHMKTIVEEICLSTNEKSSSQPKLVLLLSRICLNFEHSSISYLMCLTDDQFKIQERSKERERESLTPVSDICLQMKEMAQKLIKNFVHIQGLCISQMLRKSVETRDFLNAIEPRNVRAVMKRVVEDITAIDLQVEEMYEEGMCVRNDKSSDSLSRESRRTYPSVKTHRERSKYNSLSYLAPSTIDNSLMSNIQKIFSDRIDIFSAVEFTKISVMTGIIKISLKTFLECVRLRTFNKYGLQQTQVDTYYLQLYLLHFVADENLVHVLLDEIINSTMIRCIDPVLMEPSVVEVICERG